MLAAKRPDTKRRLAGLWEFGCAQLRQNKGFEECLLQAYKEDFAVELVVSPLTPITAYRVEENSHKRVIPGVIFIAKAKNPDMVASGFSRSKHSAIRWISESDLPQIIENEWVPDAKATMKSAFEAWKSWSLS